jgi:hypothetical protein
MYYSAVTLTKASIGEKEEALFEEKIWLIAAEDLNEARAKAEKIFAGDKHSYKNANGEEVCWEPFRLIDIFEIMETTLATGTEVYSRSFEDIAGYEQFESRASHHEWAKIKP